MVGTADWYFKDCRFDFDWVLWRCFSCWLSLQKRQEMKFSYTEWGTGLKSEYQISHPVMWSSFLFSCYKSWSSIDSFPTHPTLFCLSAYSLMSCRWVWKIKIKNKKKHSQTFLLVWTLYFLNAHCIWVVTMQIKCCCIPVWQMVSGIMPL